MIQPRVLVAMPTTVAPVGHSARKGDPNRVIHMAVPPHAPIRPKTLVVMAPVAGYAGRFARRQAVIHAVEPTHAAAVDVRQL